MNPNYNNRPTARIGRRIGSDIRISLSPVKEDPHHCTCFKVEEDLVSCKAKLEKIGCKPQILEENHGQVFGLTFRINEYEQVHIKPMPDGTIEAEVEPPPDYPGAHLNPEHSYSAHDELEIILKHAGILYNRRSRPPSTCIQRVIKKPIKPTHVVTIVVSVVLVIAFVGIFVGLAKGGSRL